MTPMQQMFLGVGAKKKVYMDDVFSTYLYTGTGSAQSINNGVDLAGEGGMVWTKSRSNARNFALHDSARGATCLMRTNGQNASYCDNTQISSFNSNGFSIGDDGSSNTNGDTYTSWTFRKTKGFFTCLTYSGTGSSQTLNHDLGCIPGMVIVKRTDTSGHWITWQKNIAATSYLALNETWSTGGDNYFGTLPTSTQFTVSALSHVNASGGTYVAYLFGGGESTAATARSVDFDNSNGDNIEVYSTVNANNPIPDFGYGTGDFTWEAYFKSEGDTGTSYILSHSGGTHAGGLYLSSNHPNQALTYINSSNNNMNADYAPIYKGQWYHVAVSRNSGTTRLFVNGTLAGSVSDNHNYPSAKFYVGTNIGGDTFNGLVSNVRIIKGTGLYTSSFKPPTEPLTNITNTVLLCCNNSSVTGATVLPSSTALLGNSSPTASTDSPFDDPAGFVFGDSGDQNVIKTGSYVGNASATGPEINLGWEPQWVMVKDISDSSPWIMLDSMRGIVTSGNDAYVSANDNAAEATGSNWLDLNPTGFQIKRNHTWINNSTHTYIYFCLRRPDGYVQKPVEDATKVFALDTGAGSTDIPNFDSGFPVDYVLLKQPATNDNWYTAARMNGTWTAYTNGPAVSTWAGFTWDSNVGYEGGGSTGLGSNWQSWQWKRHSGMDIVNYKGNGTANHQIRHSLNKTVEMLWIKNTDTNEDWSVFHTGLNGGNNPQTKFLKLNDADAEYIDSSSAMWSNTAPTATHFTVGTHDRVNKNNENNIAMLFASCPGVSALGLYAGNGVKTGNIQTIGFQPRFILIKCQSTSSTPWMVFDTLLGITSGNDNFLQLNTTTTTSAGDFIDLTSDGFNVVEDLNSVNGTNQEYIYYAHA